MLLSHRGSITATESLLVHQRVTDKLQHVWSLGLSSTSVVCHG